MPKKEMVRRCMMVLMVVMIVVRVFLRLYRRFAEEAV